MSKIAIVALLLLVGAAGYWSLAKNQSIELTTDNEGGMVEELLDEAKQELSHPLSITALRETEYPGSDIEMVEKLSPGTNYSRARVSYQSEGNTIYALMTIPSGQKPESGWPIIIFNHGYIPPTEYRTTEKYVAYQDGFARNGYITFKSDYRGHGDSEGEAVGGYGSSGYTTDVLNGLASVRKHPDADPDRVGMWGHSMGGHITLRSMVASQKIKAGVIWAGVVGSYPDLINNWRRNSPPPTITSGQRRWRQVLQDTYGSPESNPSFWDSISATSYLKDVTGPIQIHHGSADASVPVRFSELLDERMKATGKTSELLVYQGDDHNLSRNFGAAMRRSIEFFDRYVKNPS